MRLTLPVFLVWRAIPPHSRCNSTLLTLIKCTVYTTLPLTCPWRASEIEVEVMERSVLACTARTDSEQHLYLYVLVFWIAVLPTAVFASIS